MTDIRCTYAVRCKVLDVICKCKMHDVTCNQSNPKPGHTTGGSGQGGARQGGGAGRGGAGRVADGSVRPGNGRFSSPPGHQRQLS